MIPRLSTHEVPRQILKKPTSKACGCIHGHSCKGQTQNKRAKQLTWAGLPTGLCARSKTGSRPGQGARDVGVCGSRAKTQRRKKKLGSGRNRRTG